MKNLFIPIVVLLLVLGGCKKNEEITEPENTVPAEVVGTWIAAEWTFVSPDSSATADLIALGSSLTVVLQSSGRYTLLIEYPGQSTQYETGVLSFNGDQMTITSDNPNEGISVMTWSRTGNQLTLISPDDDFDFDDDGTEDPAVMTIVMNKQ